MKPETLSNEQVYSLLQNKSLNKRFLIGINKELENRRLSNSALENLILTEKNKKSFYIYDSLHVSYRILIILLPFFIIIHSIITSRIIGLGYIKKWQDYWLSIRIGFVLYTILSIFLAHYLYANK